MDTLLNRLLELRIDKLKTTYGEEKIREILINCILAEANIVETYETSKTDETSITDEECIICQVITPKTSNGTCMYCGLESNALTIGRDSYKKPQAPLNPQSTLEQIKRGRTEKFITKLSNEQINFKYFQDKFDSLLIKLPQISQISSSYLNLLVIASNELYKKFSNLNTYPPISNEVIKVLCIYRTLVDYKLSKTNLLPKLSIHFKLRLSKLERQNQIMDQVLLTGNKIQDGTTGLLYNKQIKDHLINEIEDITAKENYEKEFSRIYNKLKENPDFKSDFFTDFTDLYPIAIVRHISLQRKDDIYNTLEKVHSKYPHFIRAKLSRYYKFLLNYL